MKHSTKPVVDEKLREPLPPPAENSDIRPWIHIGEAAVIALSGVEHNMRKAKAELGTAMLDAHGKLEEIHDKLEEAHAALSNFLNVIRLWRNPPAESK